MADWIKPGTKVKKSGIYSVTHADAHAPPHEVTCVAGKVFPLCVECEEAVRFCLKYGALHVATHEQFRT